MVTEEMSNVKFLILNIETTKCTKKTKMEIKENRK